MKQTINVLSASGKVTKSAIIPALLECSDMNVLSTTRKNILDSGISYCRVSGMCSIEYPIWVASEDENSLPELFATMKQNEIRVGVISTQSVLFTEMVKNGNGGIWFSACREGLYETYLPIMEKYITIPTHIFVFDNDEAIITNAKKACRNSNIIFHKCIIHSVCSDCVYPTKHTVELPSGKECLMIFPPDAPNLETLFKSSPIWGRAEFKFTTSKEAFCYYSIWKILGINAMHTLASVKAYVAGVKEGLPLADIPDKHFSDIIPKQELLALIIKVYTKLYDKNLASYTHIAEVNKDVHISITKNFICGLYDLNEIIGRGLNLNGYLFDSKLQRHFPLLQSSGDSETVNLLTEFINLL